MTDPLQDIDPIETQEWTEAIEDVLDRDGSNRAHFLLDNAVRHILTILTLVMTASANGAGMIDLSQWPLVAVT